MLNYYTTVLILCWMSLAVLSILIHENDRIPKDNKFWFYLTYFFIATASLAEWGGRILNGSADSPDWMLLFVKCLDYILTPMAGAAIIAQMHLHNIFDKILQGIIITNTLVQILSSFNGGMVYINENHEYCHGPLYPLYMSIYFAILVLIIIQFTRYGRNFRAQNRTSLYAIMLLVFCAIAIQEFLGSEYRTSYLGLTLGAALMLIHFTGFSLQEQDEIIAIQEVQIVTDPLTGLLNRAAYSAVLNGYDEAGTLPENLAVFSIDINGLKKVNDLMGHSAGDELICGAALCIKRILGKQGKCYRTGGDEFVVLAEMTREEVQDAVHRLEEETKAWIGETVHQLSLSIGFALARDYRTLSIEKLISEADQSMYTSKADYYSQSDTDRRRHPQA